jgi:hypothetical protein
MFDISRDFWITTEPEYTTGFTRANATMTEIRSVIGSSCFCAMLFNAPSLEEIETQMDNW